MVARCQLFLLNRSPHLESLGTELFDCVRRDGLLRGARLTTVNTVQRAVNALGFCDPPHATTGRGTARATPGAQVWQQWVDLEQTRRRVPGPRLGEIDLRQIQPCPEQLGPDLVGLPVGSGRAGRDSRLSWLFSGQRSDEIARLRVSCIRWHHDDKSLARRLRSGPGA